MPLSFKDPETENLARQISRLTGESLTEVVRSALLQRLRQESSRRHDDPTLVEDLKAISDRCAALPSLDSRSADEILGYGSDGLPS